MLQQERHAKGCLLQRPDGVRRGVAKVDEVSRTQTLGASTSLGLDLLGYATPDIPDIKLMKSL